MSEGVKKALTVAAAAGTAAAVGVAAAKGKVDPKQIVEGFKAAKKLATPAIDAAKKTAKNERVRNAVKDAAVSKALHTASAGIAGAATGRVAGGGEGDGSK